MSGRGAFIVTAALTAFVLVLIGGIASRLVARRESPPADARESRAVVPVRPSRPSVRQARGGRRVHHEHGDEDERHERDDD